MSLNDERTVCSTWTVADDLRLVGGEGEEEDEGEGEGDGDDREGECGGVCDGDRVSDRRDKREDTD